MEEEEGKVSWRYQAGCEPQSYNIPVLERGCTQRGHEGTYSYVPDLSWGQKEPAGCLMGSRGNGIFKGLLGDLLVL